MDKAGTGIWRSNGEEGGKKASGQGTQRRATKIGYIYIYTYIYTNTMFNVIFWYK